MPEIKPPHQLGSGNSETSYDVRAEAREYSSEPEIHDWTGKSHEQVQELLRELTEEGYLLHGSNLGSEELHYELTPYRGHDIYRESGRQFCIYATDNYESVFPYILLNRRGLREKGFNNFTTSFGVRDGKSYIAMDKQEVLDFITEHRDEAFTDGYVYVLGPDDFTQNRDAPHEYVAATAQKPRAIIRIGAHVADELYFSDGEDPSLYLAE